MVKTATLTWNFFRRTAEVELWCGVPADQAVPAFLLSGEWQFTGHRIGDRSAPPGFNASAAAVGDRFNGFHLFHLTAAPDTWVQRR